MHHVPSGEPRHMVKIARRGSIAGAQAAPSKSHALALACKKGLRVMVRERAGIHSLSHSNHAGARFGKAFLATAGRQVGGVAP